MATIKVGQALTNESIYWFQVAAVNQDPLGDPVNEEQPAAGDEDWSTAVMFTTGELTLPNAVEGLMSQHAVDTSGNITGVLLLWNKPSAGADATMYDVEMMDGEGEWVNPTADAANITGRTSYTDPDEPEVDEMRTYRVRASNAAGDGPWSMVYYPREPGMHGHEASAPRGFTAMKDTDSPASQINLSWMAPANNGGGALTGYIIERAYGDVMFLNPMMMDGKYTIVAHPNFPFSNHMEWWETLDCAGMLKAVGSDADPTMDSADKTMYCGHYADTGPTAEMTFPPEKTIMAGSTVDMEIEKYFDKRYQVITDPAMMSSMDMGLMENTEYSYRVRATNAQKAGAWSTTEMAMTDAAVMELTAPTMVEAMAVDADDDGDPNEFDIKVTWTNGQGALSHMVLLFETANYDLAAPVATRQDNGDTTFSNVDPGTYIAVVVAYDADGIRLTLSAEVTVGN